MNNKYSSTSMVMIKSPLNKVWDALINPELVKQYFFGTNLVTTWEVGSPILFRGQWEGATYEDKGVVLSFITMESLSYSYWSSFSGISDIAELYQIIKFSVEAVSEGVNVTIFQSNVDTQERAEQSGQNWKMVLNSLKELLENN
ncbi:SRPBCC domain-containing protein [Clostridium estertheticum]|uniref:SRPBCC domain-containing protein n=1 Tax=Clostridium estertheticum TaxID=238834 RepID=UPI0013E97C0F|nr:SRPBCC domain-containing protein [Clostridium estertheticum]MBZ9685497.1 SRPBCC domain-containing protein [Clostridium estertheticum]